MKILFILEILQDFLTGLGARRGKNFAINIAKFLYEQSVKLIVIACNTSTAAALTDIQNIVNIPVVGVIEPGARAAVNATKIKELG